MKKYIITSKSIFLFLILMGCSRKVVHFQKDNLNVVNREIVSINDKKNYLILSNKEGDGLAILKEVNFDEGVIELELKGENKLQQSFVGLAFNIQNDSTYEAVYFRPFNFQTDDKFRKKHCVQYIYHPDYTWRFLRSNHEGVYEATFPRQPSPDEWFKVRIEIGEKEVFVYDQETNTKLLSIQRLTSQVSNRIGLWTGHNSKGEFRHLIVRSR